RVHHRGVADDGPGAGRDGDAAAVATSADCQRDAAGQRGARRETGGLPCPGVEQADRARQWAVEEPFTVRVARLSAEVPGDVDDEVDARIGIDVEGAAAQADGEGVRHDPAGDVVEIRDRR